MSETYIALFVVEGFYIMGSFMVAAALLIHLEYFFKRSEIRCEEVDPGV